MYVAIGLASGCKGLQPVVESLCAEIALDLGLSDNDFFAVPPLGFDLGHTLKVPEGTDLDEIHDKLFGYACLTSLSLEMGSVCTWKVWNLSQSLP